MIRVEPSSLGGQRLFDGDEEVQNHWKRNFTGFLANFLLKSGEGGYLPAQKSLIGLRRVKQGGLAFFGNELDPLWQEDKGVICHIGLRADRVRVSWV